MVPQGKERRCGCGRRVSNPTHDFPMRDRKGRWVRHERRRGGDRRSERYIVEWEC